MWLGQRWVKASPTFDAATCRRAGVAPLEFDGASDALLQSFGSARTMNYVKEHGSFHDVPARFLSAEMLRLYPFARNHGISRHKAGREQGESRRPHRRSTGNQANLLVIRSLQKNCTQQRMHRTSCQELPRSGGKVKDRTWRQPEWWRPEGITVSSMPAPPHLYDQIGSAYTATRRTDPHIAARIWAALGDARTVLNVGAGTGSYEPPDRDVTAVEPSAVMRARRPQSAARCLAADAGNLPFADKSFDAAMTVLSDHHWPDPIAGLREMARVARRVVVFQFDTTRHDEFWLTRDYLREFADLVRGPTLTKRAEAIGARMEPVPIPWDCADGFFHAYWRRPAAYLQPTVRRATSVWTRVGPLAEEQAVNALRADLDSGRWAARNHAITGLETADLGARILVA
jgi:SAM-dependent methyltransferase